MALRALLTITAVSYVLIIISYRLFFHRLSQFPGPKLAAATLLYEFYYDAILGGQYCFVVKEMHKRYGNS